MAAGHDHVDYRNFKFDIPAPDWSTATPTFTLWLPTEEKPLIDPAIEDPKIVYTEMNSFMHVTDYEQCAEPIIQTGELVHKPVEDSSTVRNANHPLHNVNVLWFGPCMKEDNSDVKKFGNIKFEMIDINGPGGMKGVYAVDNSGNQVCVEYNYYFVEVIDFYKNRACRILVTPFKKHGLREYNPYQLGGPWYIYPEGNHFHMHKFQDRFGEEKPGNQQLEIMREYHDHDLLVSNLMVSWVRCVKAEPRVNFVHQKPDFEDLVRASKFSLKRDVMSANR